MNHPVPSPTRTFISTTFLFLLLVGGLSLASITNARRPSGTSAGKSAPNTTAAAGPYRQTNLVSDLPGLAFVEDRLLVRPWGVALDSQSDFWVANNKTDVATLYQGAPFANSVYPDPALPSVGIPNPPTFVATPTLPTGVVANPTNEFEVGIPPSIPPESARFIFVTLNGGINAWRPAFGSVAIFVKFMSGHSYTGVAIGNNASGNFLFVADFANGKIDVFDKNFNESSVSGNFADPTVPASFHPYNIQNLGGSLYVTYAQLSPLAGGDFGFVRKFDTNGVRDAAFAINNGPLANPWGMAIAPPDFGAFNNLLLVGNARTLGLNEPSINAFNPVTGAFMGSMVDESGVAIQLKELRGLVFGNGVNGGDHDTLYFAAGTPNEPFGQPHGLFGSLKPATFPATTRLAFSDSEYHTNESAGHFDVTVTRTGDLSETTTVNYATADSAATQKSDYEIAVGKLTFNPGEASKSFRVLIVDNNLLGGGASHDLTLILSNPMSLAPGIPSATLISPSVARLSIMDNEFDTPGAPPNIVDATQFFVRQQYFDFLNREPDTAGFNFWTNQIASCGTDQQCIELKRINVSAAFFLSIEFQSTGMLAYLTERAAFGGLPRYGPFMRDVQALQKDYVFGAPGAGAVLEANKRAFFDDFVRRPEFAAKYDHLSNFNYVSTLMTTGGVNSTTGRLFLAELSGGQVVPPVTTTVARALAIGRIPAATETEVSFYLAFASGNPLSSPQTSAHLHGPALPGQNAPALFTLPNGEFTEQLVPMPDQFGRDFRGGKVYIDVHTQNFPNGEIRGQFGSQRFFIDVLVRGLDEGVITRAQALRLIAEDPDYRQNQFNRAFVLMEYFGYLRRHPSDPPDNNLGGYNFWLNKLNEFNGNFVNADMVKAFIKSTEYRSRFGPP